MYREPSEQGPVLVAAFNDKVFGLDKRSGQVAWKFQFRRQIGFALRVQIEGGRVYALGDELACLDYLTGRPLWRTPLSSTLARGTLLVEGGRAFVADGGEVTCLSADDGRVLWSEGFKGEGQGKVTLALPGLSQQADHRG
jgi:outer membrane protein assembly factor BamB